MKRNAAYMSGPDYWEVRPFPGYILRHHWPLPQLLHIGQGTTHEMDRHRISRSVYRGMSQLALSELN
ncbi:Uncharacterized protein HZ326_24282 [Fusarium oxysporum f. sp. albedinis]|nr:Uncharacterized protein HZ326_24282 [Fusarium oxysporum f. sp. albedinis]